MPLYSSGLSYVWTPPDHGLLAANFQPHLATGSTTLGTAGRLEFAKVRVPVPMSVTNVVFYVATAGSTLTAGQCFAVLYDGALARVGVTADQSGTWNSSGLKTMALASGPFSLSVGNYFVAFWYNGTTGPTIARAGAVAAALNNVGLSSPAISWGSADTGLTTTSPSTMGAQTARGDAWWVALT